MKQRLAAYLSCLFLLVSPAICQQLSPAVRSEVEQGQTALKNGDFPAAQKHFAAALNVNPNLAEVRADLGLAYFNNHQFDKAAGEFREALRLNPSLENAKAFLPLSQAATGECSAAMTGLERAFTATHDSSLRRLVGLSLQTCAVQQGNKMEAVRISQKLLGDYPSDPDVLYAAGQLYGNLSSELYLKLMKVAPKSARAYQVMGSVAASDGNWKGAVESYQQALKLDPSLQGVHLQIAILLLTNSPDADIWQQALTELHQELSVDPRNAEAEYEIGEVYRKHGQLKDAVAEFRQSLEIDSAAIPTRLGLAKALLQLGQKADALAALEPAEKTDPADPSVHFLLAQIYREMGRTSEASQEQAEFQRLKPAQ